MSSNPQPAGALVPYASSLPPTLGGETDLGNTNRWAAILNYNPTPGRTLYEVYSTVGQALETRTNRIAHRLGLGPDVAAQKITAFFGTGEERELRLTALRNDHEIPAKLEKECTKPMGYTLPCVWSIIVAVLKEELTNVPFTK
ncbi:hypothetical protein C8R45DRAFT_1093710 [Mycena sanguinolenta]|nr:hypothetical protein C8R45DRAFT_1093710 [Mycena sanguinolenta]